MKKKLLVLLIAAIPMLMPNFASAVAIDAEDWHAEGWPNACEMLREVGLLPHDYPCP